MIDSGADDMGRWQNDNRCSCFDINLFEGPSGEMEYAGLPHQVFPAELVKFKKVRVEITVTGPIEERTGRILSPDLLDRIYEERVESRFARRLLNDDEAFRDRVPTAENIALVLHEVLADEVAKRSSANVIRVKIVETRNNSCTTGAIA